MNKKLLFSAIAILVLVMGVYAFMHLGRKPASPANSNLFGGNGLYGQISTSTSKQLDIKTKTGSIVAVPDFTENHFSVQGNSGTYYYLTQDPNGNSTAQDYDISYGTDSSITITLLQEPLGNSRLEAEQALRKFIPIPNDQLCSLNTGVFVPVSVNSQYAGRDLGLSFCPGAVQLPD